MGTARQPRTACPSSATIRSRMARHAARSAWVAGQEDQAGPVVARRGQRDAEPGALAREERVRHLDEDARPVARVHLAAAGAAVQEVLEHREGLAHDRVGLSPLDVHHEADAAGVVLVGRIVEALRRGQPRVVVADIDIPTSMVVRHVSLSTPRLRRGPER